MGRALYSERYGFQAVAIRVEPEVIPCPSKWSIYNRFDPDSDEFFATAEYEAFMDQGQANAEAPLLLPLTDSGSVSSSDDGDSASASGLDSPPVRLSALWDRLLDESAGVAFQPVPDEQLLLDIPGYTRAEERVPIHAGDDHDRPRAVPVAIHPPSALRNSTTATDLAHALRSAPIPIPAPRAASPDADSLSSASASPTPSTPPAVHAHLQLLTPSPPPTATPRIYVWTHAPATPASPTARRDTHPAASQGPLTNPAARTSLARLTPRLRAQNV
ncbi:hypothetical protein B0H15DRAFT_237666 [Mycena belliarum]|uniref:Uncharacterized protein n=1 Tax=Mycena belliarum TaxID=1033014 RepID=A0AAD6XS53_9AGAR|nr:hypothetical protein B0H15DRAFT_237666 [Mycena belliae]